MVDAGGDGGGADGGGVQAGPNGGQTGGDEDRQQTNAMGGADLGAVAPRAPESPNRNDHIRARIAQTPDGHANLRHMPTLRAALGREDLSFGDVASLSLAPPGHVTNVPQGPGDSLPLALEAEALATRLPPNDDVLIVRSLRPADRLKGLAGIMRAANDAHERRFQAISEDEAARRAADRVRRLSFTQALADQTREAGIRAPGPPGRRRRWDGGHGHGPPDGHGTVDEQNDDDYMRGGGGERRGNDRGSGDDGYGDRDH